MAITGINPSAAQTAPKSTLAQGTVTQDDFLKLLIAQLQNQDPLQPMDNQQFAAQLATFNSLGQLIEINDKLGSLQSSQGSMNQFNAASLIGKEIVSNSNQVSLPSEGSAKIGFQLAANATRVVVKVYSSTGDLVRQIDAGAQSGGARSVVWDGNDGGGRRLASGVYGFEAIAVDAGGNRIGTTGQIVGRVTGVKLDGAEPILEVGGIEVPLSGVSTVRSAS